MAKQFFILLFSGFLLPLTAQIPKQELTVATQAFPMEQVFVSLNSKVLLAGEVLRYKAYALTESNQISSLSRILYVSLRNENDSVVFNHKIKLDKGVASGDYFLPASLKTGVYTLVGYTNFSRNNPMDAYFKRKIYVVNTFVKSTQIENVADTVSISFQPQGALAYYKNEALQDALQLNSDKSNYSTREKVSVTALLKAPSSSGNYSLSVRKLDPVAIVDNMERQPEKMASDVFYIPEMRGELLSGVVMNMQDGSPVANQTVSLTIPGEDYVFKMAKTNSSGRFFFAVDEGYTSAKSIVQLSGAKDFERKILMDNKALELAPTPPTFLKLEPNLKEWLEARSVQLQIENAYFEVKKDSVLSQPKNPPFFENLGTEYLLDDYTRFATVRETFVEIVSLAAIRGSGESIVFSVNNPYDPRGIAKFNNIPPLVLMDGMEVLDNAQVLNYNAREIESIRVINQPYRYGPKIFSGIIVITTKKGDFIPPISENVQQIALSPLEPIKRPFAVEYGPDQRWSRIPDYRVQLLWQPEVSWSGDGYETNFFTSDVTGIFEIVLEGFSDEGKFISVKNYFTVTEN